MTTPIGQADVFISHAHEDKEVARPLAEALRQRGLTVWYDEYVLRLGDSLREVIDRGLATARFGVVILSPSFFAKEWPQRELNALLARETAKRSKVLLPVWHNLTVAEIVAQSPVLADRLAVSTTQGLPFVVEQILQVLEYEKAPRVTPPPSPEPPPTLLPSPGEERVHKVDGTVLVYVPGGEYVLGADDIADNSKPVHRDVVCPQDVLATWHVDEDGAVHFVNPLFPGRGEQRRGRLRGRRWGDPGSLLVFQHLKNLLHDEGQPLGRRHSQPIGEDRRLRHDLGHGQVVPDGQQHLG